MLSQIVRPMVRTQLRLLASCQATRSTLVATVAQWLSFLGVQAQVTALDTRAGQIHISLMVGKPDACDPQDWQQILRNLESGPGHAAPATSMLAQFTPHQRNKLYRLLAYLIQVGSSDPVQWEHLYPQLQTLDLDESTLAGIRAALKVPQSLEVLLEGLDPDVAAIALPKAVNIALLDRRVNSSEDHALTALLHAMRQSLVPS